MPKFYPVRKSKRPGTAVNRKSHLQKFWAPITRDETKMSRRLRSSGSKKNNRTNSDAANRTNVLTSPVSDTRSPKIRITTKKKGVVKKYKKCLRMLKLVDLYLDTNLTKSVLHRKLPKKTSRKRKFLRKFNNKTSQARNIKVNSFPEGELANTTDEKNISKVELNEASKEDMDPLNLVEVVAHD
ncbi:unnamed protein product [Moneuplotes crassus]|uniref:Uncharacterized protein n=1 Tax=Euplotes crassus TaxID=5936 RepID=A0AAD2D2Q9_EUPCR|nr:unnamed protein product [Moneuplotes crassus]